MIIAKAPLRISIGGGGTDLPSYYSEFESTFISAAINKYIYISVHPIFINEFILKYSEMERVQNPELIKHPIIREAFLRTKINNFIEVSSFADIPAGTGLGSSGTFTVALLKALYTYKNVLHNNMQIAEEACDIEINKIKSPIGKQDQYIAAMGGLTKFHINKKGIVTAEPLIMDQAIRTDLEEHLLLFFTGYSRSANSLLKEQDDKTKEKSTQDSKEMLENLHFVQKLCFEIEAALKSGNLNEFARLMNVHWDFKKKRSKNMSNNHIDDWYKIALENGALGGKLIGAGGGGFLMFLAEDKRRLRRVMKEAGLQDVPFRFDSLGAQVMLHD